MAHYATTAHTDRSPDEAFAYVADLRNFAEWDPGVIEVVQVEGDGPALDAAFDVTVEAGLGKMTLRYVITEFEAGRTCLAVASSRTLRSVDRITVEPSGDGAEVTYDATLTLAGPLRLADPILQRAFDRIGAKAAAGLRAALGARSSL